VGRKLPTTPRSRVVAALRRLWLRCRERAAALKRAKYTCERCGRKASRAKGREVKVHVHHRRGIDWEALVDMVFERIFQTPDDLEVLCEDCHKAEHQADANG
jgi:5-methylcytosine-specific restriction endonuclease McrA